MGIGDIQPYLCPTIYLLSNNTLHGLGLWVTIVVAILQPVDWATGSFRLHMFTPTWNKLCAIIERTPISTILTPLKMNIPQHTSVDAADLQNLISFCTLWQSGALAHPYHLAWSHSSLLPQKPAQQSKTSGAKLSRFSAPRKRRRQNAYLKEMVTA